ncbi:MAG: hypothetical protein WD063_03620 [Pirellulales bacterium]
MAYLDTSFLTWFLGLIQIAGLLSAWLARLSEGSSRQVWCQRLFVGCLALVGLSTMVVVALGARYWVASGATLSAMILAAVWDFSAHARVRSL